MSRFRLLSLEQLAAMPQPEILISDAISEGDLVVLTGDYRFATALKRCLRHRAILFVQGDQGGPTDAPMQFARLREGDHPQAVLLYVQNDDRHFDAWSREADCVLDAETPDYAVVEKFREHDDDWKSLKIVGRVAYVSERW